MAKGGARAQSGPAPDPNALRRDRDAKGWVALPAGGRTGRAPKWPLGPTDLSDLDEVETRIVTAREKRERAVWRAEWRRPQAVMWEVLSLELEVAIYVRTLVAAESHTAPLGARTLLRQQQEALGLSVPGLARHRWRLDTTTDPAPTSTPARVGARRAARPRTTKERLRSLDDASA